MFAPQHNNVWVVSMTRMKATDKGFAASSPPPSAGMKALRPGPPPRIDPAVANQPFLSLSHGSPSSSLGSHPLTPRMSPSRSQTSPFPLTPSSLEFADEGSAFNSNPAATIRSALSPTLTTKSPHRATTRSETPTINSDTAITDGSEGSHTRSPSIESKSTYRTSVSSRRYRESTSTYSSRGVSISIPRSPRNFMDEVPPIPTGPLTSFRPSSQISNTGTNLSTSPPKTKPVGYGAFDLGITDEPQSYESAHGTSPPKEDTLTRSQTMSNAVNDSLDPNDNLLTRWPSQPSPTVPGRPSLPRQSNTLSSTTGLNPLQNSQPASNFNPGLGLDKTAYHAPVGSTSSSNSSRSETGSGSSISSPASDFDRKPSDLTQIDSMLQELELDQKQSPVERRPPPPSLDSTSLEPPRGVGNFDRGPDSPTDPTLVGGSYSTRNAPPPEPMPKSPLREKSPAEYGQQVSRPSTAGGQKRRCRGCGQGIVGKSVSSADGRLTGRYHKACFVCFTCRSPFETADFYVLDDHPYCSQHYHELNGSTCATCKQGIEGQYLETIENSTYGTGNPQKFHPDCLTCRTCRVVLRGDYFEWNGQVYCERDARRAAAMTAPPPGRRMPSSPLAGPPGFPPGPPPPTGYRGPPRRGGPPGPGPSRMGPGGPMMPRGPPPSGGRGMDRPPPSSRQGGSLAPPGGARRFPERRTTKLMMV
ncbi:LIM domain protein [Talaromyces stipitatus ATCC 10500]|uniref:LIM domain protein n=1 Tax=Talaromyces stipitatus (strain ATCC 10500 / CBS 375.48 / QM 6759 / NRRL 1006) TaxID=441959 RepID=B8M5F9_TALSN|nr:LIM domain protein [Talaromyces stipitatus ATCC 10500]EED19765.1 LIM domain protein [Talaromyces stipitatus ATCC 10500]